eukprot:COSAG05_NODE_462_length_9561_cov_5.923378_7_plen_200_part_00
MSSGPELDVAGNSTEQLVSAASVAKATLDKVASMLLTQWLDELCVSACVRTLEQSMQHEFESAVESSAVKMTNLAEFHTIKQFILGGICDSAESQRESTENVASEIAASSRRKQVKQVLQAVLRREIAEHVQQHLRAWKLEIIEKCAKLTVANPEEATVSHLRMHPTNLDTSRVAMSAPGKMRMAFNIVLTLYLGSKEG